MQLRLQCARALRPVGPGARRVSDLERNVPELQVALLVPERRMPALIALEVPPL